MNQDQVWKPRSRFVHLMLGATLLLALGAGEAFAQVTGKVIGTVTDGDTGAPLVGAQVVIDGTNLGNVTNEDGYYFVNNVPVGIQSLTAQYLGYQVTTRQERILAGQTMTVDFGLASEVVEVGPVVAVIEREPLVARDNTISKTRFTAEETRGLPVKDLNEVISLSAGVYRATDDTTGFIVRGGRATESATYIDGALVTDFATQTATSDIGNFAVEELDVVTGGFNAEFGHAQSGIVNIVTREGGREFHGNVRYATDGRFSTDGYTSTELANVDFNAGGLEEEKCCGFNELQASIGGPIIPDKLTFFGSFSAAGAADFDPRVAGFNPALGQINSGGSSDNILPGNRGDETRAQAKLTSFLTETSKVTGTYLYSRDQREQFQLSRGIDQHLSWTGIREKTNDIILGYDQEIFQTAERNLNLQVRGNFHHVKQFQGTPVSPELAGILRARMGAECGDDCNVDEDAFDQDFLNYRIGDVQFFFEDANPAGIPTLPNDTATEPDPIFGQPDIFTNDGMSENFGFRAERRYGVRVDLDTQLNRVHRGKVGVEWNWINLANRAGEFTTPQFADFYDVDPRIGAAYVQDRLDYGDLVIDLGLRWDHFNPNQVFPLFAGVVNCDITAFPGQCEEGAPVADGEKRNEFSPRLGVAHPITDATQVRLSYGKFHQLPELRHYYQSFATDFTSALNNPNITYGNPNLDYVETTAFEAGITHLLSENLVLDLVAYNRDRRGAIRLDVFQPGIIDLNVGERRIYVNADNGNVKGFDITLNKRYSSYFSTDLAWSLQWARGTTSNPTDFATGTGFGRLFDPLFPGRLLVPPTELLPEDFDRLHSINWQFQLRFPGDFREGTTVGTLLNDFGAYLVYNAHSGEPFTRVTRLGQGDPLEDISSSRLPWVHQGDVRFTKGLDLGGALDLELFATVINFLDIENVVRVNETTGRAERTGFEFDRSRQPVISLAFQTEASDNAFPFVLATEIGDDFRSELSRQDLNGDGTITLEESQESLFNALVASGEAGNFQGAVYGDSPYNYGEPRQFRFGAEIRF